MKVDWIKVSAISEILGAIAILTTLVFLTIEVRQGTASMNASTRQAVVEMSQRELHFLISEPELAELFYESDLTDLEETQLHFF